ncbi:UNVERIFIED_CONTAM: hypothetical protein FKN15_039258 [Acipenser sinensis]
MGDPKEKIAEGSCDENKMVKSRELEAKKSSSTDAKRERGSSESSEKRTNSKESGNKKVSKLGTVEELGKGTEDVTLEQTLSLPGPEDGKESPVDDKPGLLDLNSNSSAVIDQEGRDSNSSEKDRLFSTSSELRVHSGKDLNCNLILNERAEATKRSHDSERSEHKVKKVKTEKEKSSLSSKDKHDKHKSKSSKVRDKRRENKPPGDENKGTSREHRVLPDIRQEEELKSQGDQTGLQGSPRQERGDSESLQVSSVLNDIKEHAEKNKPLEIDGRDSKEGLIDKTPDSLALNSNSSAFDSKEGFLSIPSVLKENELGSNPMALPVKEDYSSISQEGITAKRPHQDEGKERSEQKAKKSKTEKEKSSHNSKDRHDKKKKEKEKRKEKETIKENKETWGGYSEPPDIKEEELRSLADYTGSEAVGVQGSLKQERDSEESMETKGRLKDCKVADENKEALTLNKEGDHDPEHKKEIEKVKEKKSSKKKVKKDKEHRDGHKGEKEGKKREEEGKERKEKKSKDDSDKSKKGVQKESEKRKSSKDGKDKESEKKKSKKELEEKKSKTEERKEKQQQEEASKWKWWEEGNYNDGQKWKFLEHKGPLFAPPYEPLPDNVHFNYDGKPMKLSPAAEEVATFFAKMLEHEYTSKEIFLNNFFTDWKKARHFTYWQKAFSTEMTKTERKHIKDLEKCDFKEIHKYFVDRTEEKKALPKEKKQELKAEADKVQQEFGFCLLDGHREKIGNFKVEPPGLFRGRGIHPKMGMLKKRLQPEDVIINCSKDSKIPEPPEGHRWKEVRHDNTVTWLASWTENVQGSIKYVMLNPSSKLKGEKDWQKFEMARKLKGLVDSIRLQYRSDWKAREMKQRQRGVALYFIDKVFKNLQLFMNNKNPEDDLFDRLTTDVVNKYLRELMDGLSAKVFRTFNASITLQQQLMQLTNPDDTVAEKILSYNRANRAVAILCNHQRAAPKSFEKSMENLQAKIEAKRQQLEQARIDLKKAKVDYEKKKDEKSKKVMEKKAALVKRLEEQLKKLQLQVTDREENKQIALGTSKLNYLDPRISVAWCKKFGVPIEKIYTKTHRDKFAWAIHMTDEDFEF